MIEQTPWATLVKPLVDQRKLAASMGLEHVENSKGAAAMASLLHDMASRLDARCSTQDSQAAVIAGEAVWQDISTAPRADRDNPPSAFIGLFVPGRHRADPPRFVWGIGDHWIAGSEYSRTPGEPFWEGDYRESVYSARYGGLGKLWQPTYWMPLPAPPAALAGGRADG